MLEDACRPTMGKITRYFIIHNKKRRKNSCVVCEHTHVYVFALLCL